MNSKNVVPIFVVVFLYRISLLAGWAYLVQVHGWSLWWLILVLALWGSLSSEQDRVEDK